MCVFFLMPQIKESDVKPKLFEWFDLAFYSNLQDSYKISFK